MASFSAPTGHAAYRLLLFLKPDASVKILPPDPKTTQPKLLLSNGTTLTSTPSILKWICLQKDAPLYPVLTSRLKCSQIDAWLDVARQLESAFNLWNMNGDLSQRYEIEKLLQGMETWLSDKTYFAEDSFSLADVALCGMTKPLFENVLGTTERSLLPNLCRWYRTCFAKMEIVLGELQWCADEPGWQIKEEDPEKKAKREAKVRAKEEKKLKALQKKQRNDPLPPKSNRKSEAEAKKKADTAEVDRILSLLKNIPKGQKKDTKLPMLKGYNPVAVESVWYDWWDACGFFAPKENTDKAPFVLVIPPPNVTGALHIGHALTNTVEDTIIRWKRMSGYNTLWVPGTDHAGIATQTVVEKMLMRTRSQTRHDLGREKFLDVVYEWVGQYSHKIREQLMRIGSSVDWTRKRFTLDEMMSKAVMEAFVTFHEKGLIYRENRLVNWCCALRTALSDIEVEYIDVPGKTLLSVPSFDEKVEFGVLTSFAYPLEEGNGEIVVATTRIETMLGDTAVAVHPDDPRYKSLHGQFVIHPVHGRRIPIITDAVLVDMEFGTGAVKITPAHDPNDYATGKRHHLEFIIVIDDEGKINENGGPFSGQHRFQARTTVAAFLKEKGLFRGTEENPMRLGLCSRSHDVIEPALKPQWWVNCSQMAADACQAVRDGRLTILPKDFEATWFRWLENIRDWCISRQLWWGHRIPAYYVQFQNETETQSGLPGRQSEKSDRWIVGRNLDEAQAKAKKQFPDQPFRLLQDEDVLDTWFSSGLFPFSVMGWPDPTSDFAKYYPTSLLETGHDILFFWVARMVMMGMTLTGKVPFSHVYLHGMIRDAHGRKMSKSLGNVIDPTHVIEGITLEELHKTLESGNLDAREIAKAKAGQKADFPEGTVLSITVLLTER